ncbi:MAG: DNA/RNA nuclease SfsA [Planctomycetota bacterium]|jgi:sugar fermentation stimulation protein A|nr:DNA/RNA nuclease SfsA [Planctomycetota bacterium]MDP6838562.1 DNA/RNA nuclease SfsA [Planctomycetota bacterium]MDP6954956.1 DNA/RNA nuclease SfsA [Planctomycetota bacterium]
MTNTQEKRPVLEGRLVRRYKRFLADVELPGGEVVTAHCPNTGALTGCQDAGSRVILVDMQNPKRKYAYTWRAIRIGRTWVNVDTGQPNRVVAAALAAGEIPELVGYESLRREVPYGANSRIDVLLLNAAGGRCFVEVKSTTLVDGPHAMFPDGVTARGRKHLLELRDMASQGHRAVIFFCVGRDDVDSFGSADHIDPAYGETLRQVLEEGVEALAYACHVTPRRMRLTKRLPLKL